VPPPAFCFLPYYIDQDRGWLEAWKSFGNLGQFPSHRSDVILYHSGIRSNAYYEAKARIAALSAELETVSANRAAVEQAYERIRRRTKSPSVGADPRAYQAVIQRILGDIARAQAQREVVTAKISDLTRRRIELHEQMEVVKRSLMEFDKDFKFLQEIEDEEIICPTCGTAHENSFSNRFSIAKDHESCRMLLISASAEMDDMRKKIDDHTQSLSKFNSNISSLHNALQERRGRLTVKEFIDSEGEKRALQLLWSEVSELNKAVARLDAELAELRRSLAKLSDPKIRRKIESYFAGEIAMNLNMLNVSTVPPSIASRIDSVIRDTGSDQPRALLAYYIAFIYTSLNFSSSCICPVVIDSPNQQDQDPANFNKIYEVIMDKIPDKVQTIIATVSLPMPAGEASVINMEKNIHCLISMPMPASVMI
jgi:predicted  nucleic acid-binding Zn-ribbon protein